MLTAKKAETQRDNALEEIKIDSAHASICLDDKVRQIASPDQRALMSPSEFLTLRTCNACS
jgi:hypothetical protein